MFNAITSFKLPILYESCVYFDVCLIIFRITRESANYVITVKRLGSDYDSPRHISFIINNSP